MKKVVYVHDFPITHDLVRISGDQWLEDKQHFRHKYKYMERLAEGIKASGICDPVLVVANQDSLSISGFGTTRATVCRDILKWRTIPAFVIMNPISCLSFDGLTIETEEEVRPLFKFQPKVVKFHMDGSLYIYSDVFQFWNQFPLLPGEDKLPISGKDLYYEMYSQWPEEHEVIIEDERR